MVATRGVGRMEVRMKHVPHLVTGLVLLVFSLAGTTAWSAPAAKSTGLGSPGFKPSPEWAVGWRGDGSGHFPGATPPVSWERKQGGAGYETKGIVWAAPLPNGG